MNATSLYVSTCRLVLQADSDEPNSWQDLYRLVPYLRQSLSCTVCSNLLIEPHTPNENHCQHHVCRTCRGGRKRLKPSCIWCKDYNKYVENVQLRILLQCYKKLCEYLTSTPIYRCLLIAASVATSNAANGIPFLGASCLADLITEGAGFKDDYKSNAGLSRSAYSILPCVYSTNTTSTQTAVNTGNPPSIASNDPLSNHDQLSPAIKTVSNGSSIYSVINAGIGNKITIRRKVATSADNIESALNPLLSMQQQPQSQHQIAQAPVGVVKCIPAAQLTYTQCETGKVVKSNKVCKAFLLSD